MNKLKPSQGLTIKISDDGDLQASVSKASGEFCLTLEVLQVLLLLQQGSSEQDIFGKLKQRFKTVESTLPSKEEIKNIIADLKNAGFLHAEAEKNLLNKGISDGFGDPWIQWAMLSDNVRMQKYYEALAEVINGNSTVIDVGAGTGVLSAFCLQLGAKKVFAIEETAIAATIPKILKKLGIENLNRRLDILNCSSFDANISANPDVIVSELFGNDPFSEGLLPVLSNIAESFSSRKLLFVPNALEVCCEFCDLISGPLAHRVSAYADSSSSEKVSKPWEAFAGAAKKTLDFSTLSFTAMLDNNSIKRASKSISLLKVKLDPPSLDANFYSKKINVTVNQNMQAPILIVWFRVFLWKDITLSSCPGAQDVCMHWSPVIVPLRRAVAKSESVDIKVYLSDDMCMLNCEIFDSKQGLLGKR